MPAKFIHCSKVYWIEISIKDSLKNIRYSNCDPHEKSDQSLSAYTKVVPLLGLA
jgi:hypothetical protein